MFRCSFCVFLILLLLYLNELHTASDERLDCKKMYIFTLPYFLSQKRRTRGFLTKYWIHKMVSRIFCKVHIFWEGHKILRNLPLTFDCTGTSLSEALIFASTNQQYDDRLFIELQVQYMNIPSSEHGKNMLCTEIVSDIQNNFCTQYVLPMFCKKKSFWQRFTCTKNCFAISLFE